MGTEPAPIGVFVHIYYDTVIEEIAALLRSVPHAHFYVSTTSDKKKWLIQAAFRERGVAADVRVFRNAGFDIGPLLFGFREEIRSYEICLHLHGKESRHALSTKFGRAWRTHLFRELAGDSTRVQLCRNAFARDPELGMLVPRYWRGIEKWKGLGNNWARFKSVLDQLEISVDRRTPIEYPAGSMFWFRSAAIEPLLRLNLRPADFEDSSVSAADSTLAHAIERCFLFSAAKAGYRWAFLPEATDGHQYASAPEDEAESAHVEKQHNDHLALAALFDARWYLHQYPDVANNGIDALEHYLTFGAREGRSPHPLFQAAWYLKQNPEVVNCGLTPLEHFIKFGANMGLRPHPLFDPEYYKNEASDLRDGQNPLLHYTSVGVARGLAPSREFDVTSYVRSHPDAVADPLTHYTIHGGLPPLTSRRRIQIFRRGALGDVLLMTPVLRELRRRNPTAEIVVSTLHPEILEGNPSIDFVVAAGAPVYGCDATFNLDGAYERHPDTHIVDAYANVVGVVVEDKRPEVYLRDDDRAAASKLLQDYGIRPDRPIAVLQPTAGWEVKSWTPGRFEAIATSLGEHGIQPIVLGHESDPKAAFGTDLRGKTNVRAAAAIIERSTLVVTVDSGLMHVAFAFRRPVVALFGCTLPELIVPSENLSSAVYADIPCRGCRHRQPPAVITAPACIWDTTRCMEGISLDAVLQKLQLIAGEAFHGLRRSDRKK